MDRKEPSIHRPGDSYTEDTETGKMTLESETVNPSDANIIKYLYESIGSIYYKFYLFMIGSSAHFRSDSQHVSHRKPMTGRL